MEANITPSESEDQEDYVLLDLNDVSELVDIPANAPYILSGLDTLNPVLVIDGKLKLIGEYEETVGTCIIFKEEDASPSVHEETGPSEENLFAGRCIIDSNPPREKQVNPVCQLHKVLTFKLATDSGFLDAEPEEPSETDLKKAYAESETSQPKSFSS